MDIIKELNDYLKARITPYAAIVQDAFPPAVEAIIARHDPSTARESSYIDGSFVGEQGVSYYARSIDAKKAREQLDAIITALDMGEFAIAGGIMITCQVVANTMFVSKSDTGAFVYMNTLKIEYERS